MIQLLFIIEDSLFALETWKNLIQLFKLAKIIIARRGFHDNNLIMDRIEYLENKYQTNDINLRIQYQFIIRTNSQEYKEGNLSNIMFLRKLKNIFIKTNYVDDRAVMGLKIAEQSKNLLMIDLFILLSTVNCFCLCTYGADHNNANWDSCMTMQTRLMLNCLIK